MTDQSQERTYRSYLSDLRADVDRDRCPEPSHSLTHRREYDRGIGVAAESTLGAGVGYAARTSGTGCEGSAYRRGIAHKVALRIRDELADMMDTLAADRSTDHSDRIDRLEELRRDADQTACLFLPPRAAA